MDINNIGPGKKSEDMAKEKNINIINLISGTIISILLTIFFLIIYATLLSYTNISEDTITPVILIITGICILIGSSISSINLKKQGMINGGLVGLIYVIFLYVVSSIFIAGFQLTLNTIWMIIICIVTGMIGGVIGINMKH